LNEIMYALESIRDQTVIENFIKQQDVNGCSNLINTLRYTKEETETHWLDVYSKLFKY
jgi:hypothetical protein